MSNIESRALIYQGVLLSSDTGQRIELLKMLKDSFEEENIGNAFNDELRKFLKKIDINEIPSNYTDFYLLNSRENVQVKNNIKFNNKILHQSKLIKYFENDNSKNFTKEVNDFLKKIKKKKIFFV